MKVSCFNVISFTFLHETIRLFHGSVLSNSVKSITLSFYRRFFFFLRYFVLTNQNLTSTRPSFCASPTELETHDMIEMRSSATTSVASEHVQLGCNWDGGACTHGAFRGPQAYQWGATLHQRGRIHSSHGSTPCISKSPSKQEYYYQRHRRCSVSSGSPHVTNQASASHSALLIPPIVRHVIM